MRKRRLTVQKKLSNTSKTIYNELLEETIQNILSKIRNVRSIVLFGSRAKNEHLKQSDWDIAVIADLKGNILENLKTLNRCVPSGFRAEVLGYSPESFNKLIDRYNVMALEILDAGVILFDDGYFQDMKKKLIILKKQGLERREFYWQHPS